MADQHPWTATPSHYPPPSSGSCRSCLDCPEDDQTFPLECLGCRRYHPDQFRGQLPLDQDLVDRANAALLEISDLAAPVLALAIEAAIGLYLASRSEGDAMALAGALAIATAAIEQLKADEPPRAEDGEILYRHRWYGPNKRFALLIDQLRRARDEAARQQLGDASVILGAALSVLDPSTEVQH